MMRDHARDLLEQVASGKLAPEKALEALSFQPAESLSFATIDHHRSLRQGFPEVIFGEGKTDDQVVAIAERIVEHGDGMLATRVAPSAAAALQQAIPGAEWNQLGRTVLVRSAAPRKQRGTVSIVTAGTSDLPVAEEAAVTADAVGGNVLRLTDVGVAGIHRLLARSEELKEADVVIVVAGMDGALPSVVGGLVSCPVIAVPTSVGYGASFGGIAALLTMLNSCASGVTVVNIDNGFGAAIAAMRILSDR
jgi:pyridinium-3,5-biscarboxylic acid mononucleotide synthase